LSLSVKSADLFLRLRLKRVFHLEKSYKQRSKGSLMIGIIRKVAAIRPCLILNRKMTLSIKKATVKNARKLFRNILRMKKANVFMFFKVF